MNTEQSFAFGEDQGLVGTVTLPSRCDPSTAPQGLILFNAGVLPRTGPHRLNVKLARRLASQGVATLRFDLHGHGDSARASGALSYYQQVDSDLREAMNELASRCGARQFAILGFCSGAYPAYRAALADQRVNAILLYDGFVYPTPRGNLRRYRMRIRQHGLARAVGGWLGRSAASGLDKLACALRSRARAQTARGASHPPELIGRAELVQGLNALAQRGVRVAVLDAGDGFERINYAGQFRDATRKFGLSSQVMVEFLPEINHVVTSLRSQQLFGDFVLERWLRLGLPEASAEASAAGETTPLERLSRAAT